MSKFKGYKYTWAKPFTSVRHDWQLRSAYGGINFASDFNEHWDSFKNAEAIVAEQKNTTP